MRVFIKAYESEYCGLHGMSEIDVVEARDEYHAADIAMDMGWSVIEAYDLFGDEDDIFGGSSPEFEIYEINEEFCGDKDEETILDLYYSISEDEFFNKYCSRNL